MDETGKPTPKNAEEFIAEKTGGVLSNPDDLEKQEEPSEEPSAPTSDESESRPESVGKQSAEFQLTPEIEEKVMEKVQDIDKHNIAFHWDLTAQTDSILKNGLISDIDSFKKRKLSSIYFNITGRIKEINDWREVFPDDHHNDIYLSLYSSLNFFINPDKSNTVILFDASHLERDSMKHPHRFRPQDRSIHVDEVNAIMGFETYGRIAPSFFTGLICAPQKKATENEKKEHQDKIEAYHKYLVNKFGYGRFTNLLDYQRMHKTDYFFDEDSVQKNAKALSEKEMKVNKDKPKNLLPIYDIDGNLLWPRQMSYEEVKQFVAERDAKKAQSSPEQPSKEPQEEPPIQPEELDDVS